MLKELNIKDFESCKNMIYKLALNRYKAVRESGRFDIQFDDLHSEAMLIYTMCLQTYKGNKGMKFSTYLFTNLQGRLKDYCEHSLKPIAHYEDLNSYVNAPDEFKRYEDNIVSNYDFVDEDSAKFLDFAKDKLSYEAFEVLKYIMSMNWVSKKVKTKPSVKSITQKFGYEPMIVESIMGEIRDFWKKEGYMVA